MLCDGPELHAARVRACIWITQDHVLEDRLAHGASLSLRALVFPMQALDGVAQHLQPVRQL